MNETLTIKTTQKLDFNELGVSPKWLAKFNLECDSLWQYPDRSPLEQALADQLDLLPNQILACNGGDEAINVFFRWMAEQQVTQNVNSIILPLPAFSQYTQGIESWPVRYACVNPNDDLSINLDELKSKIKKLPKSWIVLTSPNNPTGELITSSELIEIIKLAKENQSYVFLDEAYIEFSVQASFINRINQFNNLVVLRTLSKAFGLAGIRFGYIAGNSELIAEFNKRTLPFNIPSPTLQIAAQTLTKDAYVEMSGYVEKIKANRKTLFLLLTSFGIEVTRSEANFLLFKVTPIQKTLCVNFLNKNEILVRTFNQPLLKNTVRITIPFNIEKLQNLLTHVFNPDSICFDMDGVLINTENSYDEAIKQTYFFFTNKVLSACAINKLRRSGGFNNDWRLTEQLILNSGVNVSFEQVFNQFQKLYLGSNNDGLFNLEKPLINNETCLLINKLQYGVVTGRNNEEARKGNQLLRSTIPSWLEKATISDDDVSQSKPSPEGILKLIEYFNSRWNWMIGDTPDDMQAAVASKSIAIGIGNQNAEQLFAAGADIVLDSVNQLEQLLPRRVQE